MPTQSQEIDHWSELVGRVIRAKDAAHFNRADRQFEYTGPQMEELSSAIAALVYQTKPHN